MKGLERVIKAYRGPIAQPGQDFTETTGVHLKAREMSGMSYIEIVKWENEYRSEEQITMARTEIFSSYDVLHHMPYSAARRRNGLVAPQAGFQPINLFSSRGALT